LISWINCEFSKEVECKFDKFNSDLYSSCVIIGLESMLEVGGKSERTDQVGFSGFKY